MGSVVLDRVGHGTVVQWAPNITTIHFTYYSNGDTHSHTGTRTVWRHKRLLPGSTKLSSLCHHPGIDGATRPGEHSWIVRFSGRDGPVIRDIKTRIQEKTLN